MLFPAIALALLAAPQVPAGIQDGLRSQEASERLLAAVAFGRHLAGDEEALHSLFDKGSPEQQRAVLLGAALSGTTKGKEAVLASLSRRSRQDRVRPWAFLLAGAYLKLDEGERRGAEEAASTSFERLLFHAGSLAVPRATLQGWEPIFDRSPRGLAMEPLLRTLVGQPPRPRSPGNTAEMAALCLASLLPGGPAVQEGLLDRAQGRLPALWWGAAYREPTLPFDSLSRLLEAGGAPGLAVGMAQLPAEHRDTAFEQLDRQLYRERFRSYLWGTAGSLGLSLPPLPPERPLPSYPVAALLSARLSGQTLALEELTGWRESAQVALSSVEPELTTRGALALALLGDADDLELLRKRSAAATDPDQRAELQQLVLLASSGKVDPAQRAAWLRGYALRYHAGVRGFLGDEVGRWLALLLAGHSRAADPLRCPDLGEPFGDLPKPKGIPATDTIFEDLLELLLSEYYALVYP